MGKLLDLTFYNPAQLKDEDFLKGFVARRGLADKILGRLSEIKHAGLAQHRLILGQRGMGKTSLLRRIALGVRDSPALAATLLPLSFREEQYNVHNLHVFWCNCLDALGDGFEAAGQREKAQSVDRDVAALDWRADDEEGTIAFGVFSEWIKREGKRPLLLLDNIDLVFRGLKDKQWSLRRVLQKSGGIVVIGASTGFLEATVNPKAAFYDFFQVDVLEKLGHAELLSCLRQLAAHRAEAGQKVLRVLDRDPGRIHVLYDLTGGNPRTLAMLYLMLEVSDESDLMRDLEWLLDLATPLYKARVEEFAPQTRVVFDAVALAWNPVIAADVAAATGLETGAVSTQLDRLHRDGVLEKATVSSSVRTAFQVSERFFNVWYLMRRAPRRQRSRLRWLTEFLRCFYTPHQLAEVAAGLIKRGGVDHLSRGTYCLALSDAVDEPDLRETLRYEASQEIKRHAAETGVPVESVADPAELCSPTTSQEWYRHARVLLNVGLRDRAEAAYRQAIELEPNNAWARDRLADLYVELGRYEEAEAAYRTAAESDPTNAWHWHGLGSLLHSDLGRFEEAELAYRRAIALEPGEGWHWDALGGLLEKIGRYEGAEVAYREGIKLDPKNAWLWTHMGSLMVRHLSRYEDAEDAYRKAIEIDPKNAWPWNYTGRLLQRHLGRYEEAEAAFRTAIELDPTCAVSWNNLGGLLADFRGRQDEAEQAYRQSIEIDPEYRIPAVNLAYLLLGREERGEEAENCYQRAVALLPVIGAGLLRAFHALTEDNFGAATTELTEILEKNEPALFTSFFDDLMRVLRLAAARGYGERLLKWLEESGLKDRYWPLSTAYDAFLHGEDRLRDVNPEVRGVAQRIFSMLMRGRGKSSAALASRPSAV